MTPQMSFEELDVVQLLLSLLTRHGPSPVGTIGTIVSNYGDPDSDFVEVEFDAPWHVVTVAVTALAPWRGNTSDMAASWPATRPPMGCSRGRSTTRLTITTSKC